MIYFFSFQYASGFFWADFPCFFVYYSNLSFTVVWLSS